MVDPSAKTTAPASDFHPTRRRLLQSVGLTSAGLWIGFRLGDGRALAAEISTDSWQADAFVRIGTDDLVTVMIKHIEFGQGVSTGLPTIVAEELDAAWEQMRFEHAPADETKYNNLLMGPVQGTGGSTAVANSWQQLRQAGATARALLVAAAAQEWEVPAAEISVDAGRVSHAATGRSSGFGALTATAATLPVPAEVVLKDPKDFKLVGKARLPKLDAAAKSDGSARFTQDLYLRGMSTALVAHAPRFGAKVKSFDPSAALKVNGVQKVVEIPTGVAVVASGFWAAKKGRDALEIEWDESAAETRGDGDLEKEFSALLAEPGAEVRSRGDVEAALAGAAKVLQADYAFPYLAHAPMETLDYVVHLEKDRCRAWGGSQIQTLGKATIAQVVGLAPEQVELVTMLGGGSFGRRATPTCDIAFEAASVAMAVGSGKPIKVVWTREDDIRGGYYRPLYLHRLRAGLDAEGRLIAWHHRIVGQSILAGTLFEQALVQDGIDSTSVEGARGLPYAVENFHNDLHSPKVGVPVLWWRSVGHTHNGYSTETFFDQAARLAGRDPYEWRRELLADKPRHRAVLDLAAQKAGWGTPLAEGQARGIALHESFGSIAAQVAEISLDSGGGPKVERVVCAVDCGVAINPDIVTAQMESGIGYGLNAALYGEIRLDQGRVVESNFHQYRPLRIHEMPRVEVHIVPSSEAPTGVGEPGVPPIAPAVANAYLNLTGKAVHRLPFSRWIAEAHDEEVG